jgi:hypothetical protein
MMMVGTDDTDGSLSKSQIGTDDGPCRDYGQAQIKHRKTQKDPCRDYRQVQKDSERLRDSEVQRAGLITYWNSEDEYN